MHEVLKLFSFYGNTQTSENRTNSADRQLLVSVDAWRRYSVGRLGESSRSVSLHGGAPQLPLAGKKAFDPDRSAGVDSSCGDPHLSTESKSAQNTGQV